MENILDNERVSNASNDGGEVLAEARTESEAARGNEAVGIEGALEQKENEAHASKDGEFGKFSDSRALLNAYNALQSEFTKRCQKLKVLEARVNTIDSSEGRQQNELSAYVEEALNDDEFVDDVILGDVRVYKRAIARYLGQMTHDSLLPKLQRSGFSALTPVKKPKSLADAKRLTDLMLGK